VLLDWHSVLAAGGYLAIARTTTISGTRLRSSVSFAEILLGA